MIFSSQPADDTDHQITPAAALGAEPGPPVSVHPHMVYGSGLTDPLDFAVLLHLLFMSASGKPFKVAAVLAALRAENIRSGNGSGLVGRDAVYASFTRLTSAGFIRRTQGSSGGKFGAVVYEMYQHPAYNPDRSPGTTALVEPRPAPPETVPPARTDKTAAENVSGIAVSGIPGHGDAVDDGHGKTAVHAVYGTAGSTSATPPYPPGGGGPSSTRPFLRNTSTVPAGADPAGDAGFAQDDSAARELAIRSAGEFLADLPGDWACGRKTVAKLAPLLAETIAAQGWPLGHELATRLTGNSGGVRSFPRTLQHRIEDLPRYRARHGVPIASPCPQHPFREAAGCPPCTSADGQEPDSGKAPPDSQTQASIDMTIARMRERLGDEWIPGGKRAPSQRRRRRPHRDGTPAPAEIEAARARALRELEEQQQRETPQADTTAWPHTHRPPHASDGLTEPRHPL
ncbi:hypothetical protein AB0C81_18635 [Streptomyces roseoverticillatus]|uniref:hypothetical protein n=1 Tax=Streptomyces roseoverticillatus TaxID=66429 RepID=UPI0033C152D4